MVEEAIPLARKKAGHFPKMLLGLFPYPTWVLPSLVVGSFMAKKGITYHVTLLKNGIPKEKTTLR